MSSASARLWCIVSEGSKTESLPRPIGLKPETLNPKPQSLILHPQRIGRKPLDASVKLACHGMGGSASSARGAGFANRKVDYGRGEERGVEGGLGRGRRGGVGGGGLGKICAKLGVDTGVSVKGAKSIGRSETSPWDRGAHPEVHTEECEGVKQGGLEHEGVGTGIKRWGIGESV